MWSNVLLGWNMWNTMSTSIGHVIESHDVIINRSMTSYSAMYSHVFPCFPSIVAWRAPHRPPTCSCCDSSAWKCSSGDPRALSSTMTCAMRRLRRCGDCDSPFSCHLLKNKNMQKLDEFHDICVILCDSILFLVCLYSKFKIVGYSAHPRNRIE